MSRSSASGVPLSGSWSGTIASGRTWLLSSEAIRKLGGVWGKYKFRIRFEHNFVSDKHVLRWASLFNSSEDC